MIGCIRKSNNSRKNFRYILRRPEMTVSYQLKQAGNERE
jgi:hypothetical protein